MSRLVAEQRVAHAALSQDNKRLVARVADLVAAGPGAAAAVAPATAPAPRAKSPGDAQRAQATVRRPPPPHCSITSRDPEPGTRPLPGRQAHEVAVP
jgi:hypothetical protein